MTNTTEQATEPNEPYNDRRFTEEQAQRLQPGDVVFYPARHCHMVIGNVRPTGIAAPLFRLEEIGREDNHDGVPQVSWRLVAPRLPGQPPRAPYRGGRRHSVRTLRERGELLHPIPGEPERPDEVYEAYLESLR